MAHVNQMTLGHGELRVDRSCFNLRHRSGAVHEAQFVSGSEVTLTDSEQQMALVGTQAQVRTKTPRS